MGCLFTNVFADGEPTPLLKASRELRLTALRIMPELITALKDKVTQQIGEIEGALATARLIC